jgi:NTE family protein
VKRVGLALGGGGARGVAHIAYLKALDDEGIRPCVISGTSSGAIAGALFAGGLKPDETLERIQSLINIHSRKGADRSLLQKRPGGWAVAVAQRSLARILPKKRFEDLDIPLKVVATNFHTLQERVFESGELLPAVMASIALPSAFAPQPVDGEYYMDGGATNIVPFDIIRNDCDVLIAIDVSLVRPVPHLKPTRKNAGHSTWAATQEAYISTKLKTCPVEIFERPTFPGISTMEFFKYKTVYDQALGYLPDFIDKVQKADIKG